MMSQGILGMLLGLAFSIVQGANQRNGVPGFHQERQENEPRHDNIAALECSLDIFESQFWRLAAIILRHDHCGVMRRAYAYAMKGIFSQSAKAPPKRVTNNAIV